MVKKRRPSSESESEEEQYVVEVVTKAKVEKIDGELGWTYYVKWAGYDSDSNTWEPEGNLHDCDRLLRSFWTHIGTDNEDYLPGYVAKAQPEWIAKEKRYFRKNYDRNSARTVTEAIADSSESDEHEAKRAKREASPNPSQSKKGARRESASKAKSKGKVKGPKPKKAQKGTAKERDKHTKVTISSKGKGKAIDDPPESDGSDDALASQSKKRPRQRDIQSSDNDRPPRKSAKVKKPPERKQSTKSSSKGKERAMPQPQPRADSPGNESSNSLFSEPSSPDLALSSLPTVPKPAPIAEAEGTSAGGSASAAPQSKEPAAGKTDERKKPERRGVKMLSIDIKDNSGAAPIRTKARLAGLSFKKTSGTGSNPSTPTIASPTLPSTTNAPTKPLRINTQVPGSAISDVAHFVDSPASLHGEFEAPLPGPSRPSRIPLPRRSGAPSHMSPAQQVVQSPVIVESETDRFLASVMPPELAAPLVESDGNATPQSPQVLSNAPILKRTALPKALPAKIAKKWRWAGELFVDVDQGKADLLCKIAVFDTTTPRPGGYRLDVCLSPSVNSIRFRKMHNFADIWVLLRNCGAVQQYARIGRDGEEDTEAFNTLADYMTRKRMFTYAELHLRDAAVAYLLVIPTASENLRNLLQAPLDLIADTALIGVVLPWDVTSHEYEQANWRKHRGDSPPSVQLAEPPRPLLQNIALHRAIHMLRFPKSLFEYMTQPERPYCIWSPNDGTSDFPGMETRWLRTILDFCKPQGNLGYKKDVRVVFVHVGALASLRDLPALAERRQKQYALRFYTYGTHYTIPPERWGVRQIYPHGGVVTFTPSAIYQDPAAAVQLMQRLDVHPLWCAYILPTSLALLANLTCQDQNPLDAYDKGEIIFDEILQMIEDGEISLLRAPSLSRQPHADKDLAMRWVQLQLGFLSLDKRGLLQRCVESATKGRQGDEMRLQADLEEQIAADLHNMMLQPAIMDGYRRFVVVHGSDDRMLVRDDCGIECTRVSHFRFRDDFFTDDR